MARACWQCLRPIYECMGAVSAGDLLRFMRGEIPGALVRETCGHCVMRNILLDIQVYPSTPLLEYKGKSG